MTNTPLFVSQKALIVHEGKLLVVMEADNNENVCIGKRCLPGGRMESNETLDQAFDREVMEEIGIKVQKHKLLAAAEYRPEMKDGKLHIVSLMRYCTTQSIDITLSTEHSEYKRVSLDEYLDLERTGDEDKGYHALVDYLKSQD